MKNFRSLRTAAVAAIVCFLVFLMAVAASRPFSAHSPESLSEVLNESEAKRNRR